MVQFGCIGLDEESGFINAEGIRIGDLIIGSKGEKKKTHIKTMHGNIFFDQTVHCGDIFSNNIFNRCISLFGEHGGIFAGSITLGGSNIVQDGKIFLVEHMSTVRSQINFKDIFMGGQGLEGDNKIHIDGESGNILLGGQGAAGNLLLFPSNAPTKSDWSKASISMDGETGSITSRNIFMGGQGLEGDNKIHIDGESGNILLGGQGAAGNLLLFPSNAPTKSDWSKASISMDGETGDIILGNADCAEDFEISTTEKIEPGTVMTLNNEGQLEQSSSPYDKSVAGVVSGAGNLKPGLILGRQPGHMNRLPIALIGKVFCKVDATYGAIEVGDLLTTSATLGHAMKASDPIRSFGAVIGKALSPPKKDRDLIPILVALQ
jgi:hypothetical protein